MTPLHCSPVHRTARAFTLLETVLAAVLGLLVITAALALFKVVDKSEKRSELQMTQNSEFAAAHQTIAKALTLLLMSNEQPPNERDTEEFLKKDDERNSEDRADEEDEEAASTRLALQPDTQNPVAMLIGVEGRQRQARSQTLRVTLRDTPVLDSGEKTPEQQYMEAVKRERYLLKQQERLGKRFGSSAKAGASDRTPTELEAAGSSSSSKSASSGSSRRRGGSSLDDALAAADSATRGGREGSRTRDGRALSLRERLNDDRTASERLEEEEEDRPRAPGIRGVFELLPDDQSVEGGSSLMGSRIRNVSADEALAGPTYSLWWRELPPLEIDPLSDTRLTSGGERGDRDNDRAALSAGEEEESSGAALSDSRSSSRRRSSSSRAGSDTLDGAAIDRQVESLARSSEGSGKRVRLLSGLKTCHWTAFRGRKERDKITAKFEKHLPAFIELEIVTASGRRENWMFDVAWTTGPEPGSIMPDQPDPLNNPGGGLNQPADTNGDGVIDDKDVPNNPTGNPNNPGGNPDPSKNPGGPDVPFKPKPISPDNPKGSNGPRGINPGGVKGG